MTPLRQLMIREMQLQQFTPQTIDCYVDCVARLARFYGRSPDQLCLEDVRSYLHYLCSERQLSVATCNQRAAAITFFFRRVLKQTDFDPQFRRKHSRKLPEVYSHEELARLFEAARHPKHRALLMTTYAAGLRVSEVVRLQPRHIHSERMLIRVEQGKGRKDRYTLLSEKLLAELRNYWKVYRPGEWLFPRHDRTGPLSIPSAQQIWRDVKRRAGLQRGRGIHTLRHCFGTHLLEAGVDVRTIQLLMGHKRLHTTAVYLHLTPKRLERMASTLDLLRLPQADDVDANGADAAAKNADANHPPQE